MCRRHHGSLVPPVGGPKQAAATRRAAAGQRDAQETAGSRCRASGWDAPGHASRMALDQRGQGSTPAVGVTAPTRARMQRCPTRSVHPSPARGGVSYRTRATKARGPADALGYVAAFTPSDNPPPVAIAARRAAHGGGRMGSAGSGGVVGRGGLWLRLDGAKAAAGPSHGQTPPRHPFHLWELKPTGFFRVNPPLGTPHFST